MTIIPPVLSGLPYHAEPFSNITPFTYRSARTFAKFMEEFRAYLNLYVVEHMNEETKKLVNTINDNIDKVILEVNNALAGQASDINTLVQQIINSSIEVQDPVVAGMLGDLESLSRGVLNGLYSDKAIQTEVEEGRLSVPGLDAVYTHVEPRDINLRDEGVLSTNTASVNRVTLQGIIDGAPEGSRLVLPYTPGTILIDAPLTVTKRLRFEGIGGKPKIKQTSSLVPIFQVTGVADVEFVDLALIGLKTDYVNTEGVYGATAIRVTGTGTILRVDNCTIDDIAGAGIFVNSGSALSVDIRNTRITGVGLVTLGSSNYSAGIVIQDAINDVTIESCDISQISQGVTVGHGCKRVKVSNNRIHHTAEHGGYFATSDTYIIAGNFFYDTGLLGFKIQNGKTGYVCRNAVITDNVLERTGSNSVMITNAVDTTDFIQNVVIEGNVISASGDTGFRVDRSKFVTIANNIVNGARFGIRLFTSNYVRIHGNQIAEIERTGILIEASSSVVLSENMMINLGIVGPEKVAIIVQGVVSNLRLDTNHIDYDKVAQTDGLLFGAGTYANIQLLNNYFHGSNWGMRTAAASAAVTMWRNNYAVAGAAGSIDGIPSFITAIPDSSGFTLPSLEVEVNKLKTILRTQRDGR